MKFVSAFHPGRPATAILSLIALSFWASSFAQTAASTNATPSRKDRLSELFGDPVVPKVRVSKSNKANSMTKSGGRGRLTSQASALRQPISTPGSSTA